MQNRLTLIRPSEVFFSFNVCSAYRTRRIARHARFTRKNSLMLPYLRVARSPSLWLARFIHLSCNRPRWRYGSTTGILLSGACKPETTFVTRGSKNEHTICGRVRGKCVRIAQKTGRTRSCCHDVFVFRTIWLHFHELPNAIFNLQAGGIAGPGALTVSSPFHS